MLIEGFCVNAPHPQNELDVAPGWLARMPDGDLTAGEMPLFEDVRVTWAAAVLGGLQGRQVLEIGPYEAYNTWQMEKAGAHVTAIEASRINFVRCLIVKNLYNLKARFLLGDARQHVENNAQLQPDIIWLSGVIYHQLDPVGMLRACARATDSLFIWTHYFDDQKIAANPGDQHFFDPERNRWEDLGSLRVQLHCRAYRHTVGDVFSGGASDHSFWLSRSDLFATLEALGFGRITMGVDNPDHPNGPACFFVAQRS